MTFIIGMFDFYCMVAFAVGLIWFFIAIVKKGNKTAPIFIMIISITIFSILIIMYARIYEREERIKKIEEEVMEELRHSQEFKQSLEESVMESQFIESISESIKAELLESLKNEEMTEPEVIQKSDDTIPELEIDPENLE